MDMAVRIAESGGVAVEPIASETLTRKFLMAQVTGLYLVSNRFHHGEPLRPIFAERIAEPVLRAVQWERMKRAKVTGRLCRVFEKPEDYIEWAKDILAGLG